jgi:hypothetical protein
VRSWTDWWNWKHALTSALGRAPLFFVVNLSAGPAAALAAFAVEFGSPTASSDPDSTAL